jgi:hypothetical protein
LAADEFESRGDVNSAVEAHFRAAEMYLQAMNDATDETAKTLKLLFNNHTRRGKELQRRSSREEHVEWKREPAMLPIQSLDDSISPRIAPQSQNFQPVHLQNQSIQPVQKFSAPQKVAPAGMRRNSTRESLDECDSETASQVLELEKIDKFWDVVEGFVSKLSRGAADISAKVRQQDVKNAAKAKLAQVLPTNLAAPKVFGYPELRQYQQQVPLRQTEPNSTSDSFFVIGDPLPISPPSPEPPRLPSVDDLMQENQQLRETIASLTLELDRLSRRDEEIARGMHSIRMQFQDSMQQSLHGDMPPSPRMTGVFAASPLPLDLGNADVESVVLEPEQASSDLSIEPEQEISLQPAEQSVSPEEQLMSPGEHVLSHRVAELEAELDIVRAERQRYKDRWDRLKESAKKKREEKQQERLEDLPKLEALQRKLSGPEQPLKGLALLIQAERRK